MVEQVRPGRWQEGLDDSAQRLRLIIENARGHAIFTIDPSGTVLDWLGCSEAVFGYSAEEIVGQHADILFVTGDRAECIPEQERTRAAAEGKAQDVRWHLRKDGRRVLIDGAATALVGADGTVVGFLKIGQDVTARHLAEQRQELLLRELQHRVRNTLAVTRSIVRRTAENSSSIEDMAMHLEGRIEAFARVQTVATRDLKSGVDLGSLVADELLAHAVPEGERLVVEGPDVLLRPKAAEALSLAVHELATNSIKYGALAKSDGLLSIRWKWLRNGHGDTLQLVWEEHGRSRLLVPVQQDGFGFELLQRTLPYELDADTQIEFLDDGLRFTLRMPLSRAAQERRAEEAES